MDVTSWRPLLHLMVPFFLHTVGAVIAWPAVADVVVKALCRTDKCSEAIYISGIQHTTTGVGTMFITPWLGALSDDYGRKPLIILCFAFSVLPFASLAYSRTRLWIYIYWIVKTISAIPGEGTIMTLILAYTADVVPAESRPTAFGWMMGIMSVGFLVGTVIARFLPEDTIFHVATILLTLPVVYILMFVPETLPQFVVAPGKLDDYSTEGDHPRDPHGGPTLIRRSTLRDSVALIWRSRLLTQIVIISFLSAFAENGLIGSLLYFLKAEFHFAKNEFAQLFLTIGITSFVSQLVLLPVFVYLFGVRFVLCCGVFFGALHVLLYGIAWADWVPYFAASMASFVTFIFPAIGSIVSMCGSADDQGKLQGLVTGVRSLASAAAPLIINPLTALFVSTDAPFDCPGFGLIFASVAEFISFILAIILPPLPGGTGDNHGLELAGSRRGGLAGEDSLAVGDHQHRRESQSSNGEGRSGSPAVATSPLPSQRRKVEKLHCVAAEHDAIRME